MASEEDLSAATKFPSMYDSLKEPDETPRRVSKVSKRRRWCKVPLFLFVCAASAALYLFFLLIRTKVMLQPEQISIAFEDGGIQTNISLQSQVLPGRASEEFALDFGRLQCGISSRMEAQRPGFTQRDGTSHHLFSIRFGGNGNHRLSNGLTRTETWQIVLEDGECVFLLLLVPLSLFPLSACTLPVHRS